LKTDGTSYLEESTQVSDESVKVTPELAYVCGVLLGDGCISGGQVGMNNSSCEFGGEFARTLRIVAQQYLGHDVHVGDSDILPENENQAPRWRWVCCDPDLYNMFRNFNKKGKESGTVMNDPILQAVIHSEHIGMFLRGLYDSEGSVYASGEVAIRMSDEWCLHLIRELLSKSGIKYDKLSSPKSNGRRKDGGPCKSTRRFHISTKHDNLIKFRDKVGFTIYTKKQRLDDAIKYGVHHPKIRENTPPSRGALARVNGKYTKRGLLPKYDLSKYNIPITQPIPFDFIKVPHVDNRRDSE